jgi:hypothetical protein
MKKLLFLLVFLPFLVFAADSVEINGVSVQGQTATANGTSVYDTSSFTSVAFDSNEAIITSDTSWNVSNVLKAGTHIVNASVGAENATFTFDIHSGEGGILCPNNPELKCGLFAPTIPDQRQKPEIKKVQTIPLFNFWQELQRLISLHLM